METISDKELIGLKVKGFKFPSKIYDGIHYSINMDSVVNETGTITRLTLDERGVIVEFKRYNEGYNSWFSWCYPKELVIKQLLATGSISNTNIFDF